MKATAMTERQVDEEHPPPPDLVREHAAEQRPNDARQGEDRPKNALITRPLCRDEQVGRHGKSGRRDRRRAEPLHPSKDHEREHRSREPAQHRTQKKDADAR